MPDPDEKPWSTVYAKNIRPLKGANMPANPPTTSADLASILIEELDRLTYPLPIEIARRGPKAIHRLALERLQAEGKPTTFTRDEYRLAVVKVLKQLASAEPPITLSEDEAFGIHAHAAAELHRAREGNLDYTAEQYVQALTLAGFGVTKTGGQ